MSVEAGLMDMHCHLDLMADFEHEAQRRQEVGLWTLAVTTLPQAWERNCEVVSDLPMIEAALGIHPELVDEHPNALDHWQALAESARFVGEVGLDGRPRNRRSMAKQRYVFAAILDACSEYGDKVLSVHSAGAQKDVLDLLEERLDFARNRVVLHWFTGSRAQFARASKIGCFFSVNPTMLKKDRLLGQLREIPISRLLTESDAPFLEASVDELPAAEIAVRGVASALGVSRDTVARQLWDNLKLLLDSGGPTPQSS